MAEKQNYKTMMAELTQLLADMQSENADVDETIVKFERGQELIAQLRDYLKKAENTITKHKIE